jgi:hypothetical protein
MEKRQGLVPVGVLLGALALLLACSRITGKPEMPGAALQPRLAGPDWAAILGTAADAATLIATIAGLVALVLAKRALETSMAQLRAIEADQARIAAELSRRPELSLKLGVDLRTWWRDECSPDQIVGGRRQFDPLLVIRNDGQKSARNLHLKIEAPRHVKVGLPGFVGCVLPVVTQGPVADVLHPSQQVEIRLAVEINADLLEHDCEVRATLAHDDWAPVVTILTVGTTTNQARARATWPVHHFEERVRY